MLEAMESAVTEPAFDIDMESLCSCEELYWMDCYSSDSRYKKFITPESFEHPAKASFGLIDRIYRHLELLGLLKQEDVVIDFMAGVGRIPLVASLRGHRTIAVELELNFTEMMSGFDCDGETLIVQPIHSFQRVHSLRCGKDLAHTPHHIFGNKTKAEDFTGKKLDMQIIQADARNLSQILTEKGVGIVSPPYVDKTIGTSINAEDLIRKTPSLKGRNPKGNWFKALDKGYSLNPDNIANLKDEPAKVGIISPPYVNTPIAPQGAGTDQSFNKTYLDSKKTGDWKTFQAQMSKQNKEQGYSKVEPSLVGILSPAYGDMARPNRKLDKVRSAEGRDKIAGNYNPENPDNIGNLRDDSAKVGVISPPYGDTDITKHPSKPFSNIEVRKRERDDGYSNNQDNIGNLKDDANLVGITSPPYQNTVVGADKNPEKRLERIRDAVLAGTVKGRESVRLADKGAFNSHSTLNLPEGYSENAENIGNLKDDSSLVGITSPPYLKAEDRKKHKYQTGRISANLEQWSYEKQLHGTDLENIGNLSDNQPKKVGVVSPPYGADSEHALDNTAKKRDSKRGYNDSSYGFRGQYSQNEDNLGNHSGETYTEAMTQCYAEAFKAGISPLVIITKNPTRNGMLRRLDISTVQMLEKCGYRIIDYHRAILFKTAKNATLDGSKEAESYKGRISFFKRLSLQGGNVASAWEDIIFAVNPNGNFGKIGATSPPYENSLDISDKDEEFLSKAGEKHHRRYTKASFKSQGYSQNTNNIGNLKD